ncbi:uncharacterized protein LOC110847479 isoform X2 [Folsomia candida]|uniref:uncharacterized protein LOC110847479 isoform X2 n=1 Tax=Folsomia candida TaxID=158441 RepID=UPI001604AACB|nr:uncharacterized protein LOC110847479 isoform X2 [Folsomia candida]
MKLRIGKLNLHNLDLRNFRVFRSKSLIGPAVNSFNFSHLNYTELQYLVENRAFAKMASKTCSTLLFVYLIGSTLCVIPEGEYQIGPVFGPGPARFFGHKYFEAFVDKGQLKPLLAKKALLGVVGVGAVAAAGGAALIAKKIHESKGFGHGLGGGGHGGWYPPTQGGSGWAPSYSGNDYSQGGGYGNVNFPATTDYHYQSQTPGQVYGTNGYEDNSAYNNGYDYGGGSSNGYYGWSR